VFYNYRNLETNLTNLLAGIESLTPLQRAEVEEYISVGEYGLAFEYLCAFLEEENKPVPVKLRPVIRSLAEQMNIDSNWWVKLIEE